MCGGVPAFPALSKAEAIPPMILSFTGRAEEYRLFRHGAVLRVMVLEDLNASDQLTVLSAGGCLKFRLSNKEIKTIRPSDGTVVVPISSALPTQWANAWSIVKSAVGMQRDNAGHVFGARGSERLSWPFTDLAEYRAAIPYGNRPLSFAWIGGQPPFRVIVHQPDGGVFVDEAELYARQLDLKPRDIVPGSYTVYVIDHGGHSIDGGFSALSTFNWQPTRDAATAIQLAADMLAAEPGLSFSAFQFLVPYRGQDESATDFLMVLANPQS